MAAPTAGVSHDIVFVDDGGNRTGFMLWRDPQTNAPKWERSRVPVKAPLERSLQATAVVSPLSEETTWAMESTLGGFGQHREPLGDTTARYGFKDGVSTLLDGELSLDAILKPGDVLIRNGGGEKGSVTDWTASGDTTIALDIDPADGVYSFKLTHAGTSLGAIAQTLSNHLVYAGLSLTVSCVAKETVGGTSEDVRITINDGVGTTNGTAVTLTSSYQKVTATRTIDATPTTLVIKVERQAGGAASNEIQVDNIVEHGLLGDQPIIKFERFGGNLYAATSTLVMQWDTANEVFIGVFASTGITDIKGYAGNLFVARGSTGAYEYSADPTSSAPNFTTSTQAGNSNRDNDAKFFVITRDVFWKALDTNGSVASTSTPLNGGAWTEVIAGDNEYNFTSLIAHDDVPVAGKEDGIYYYDRTNAAFIDATPGLRQEADILNADAAVSHRGFYWYSTHGFNLSRYTGMRSSQGDRIEEFGHLFKEHRFEGKFTGRIISLASVGGTLYALTDTNATSDSDGETTWLMSLQEIGGRFIVDSADEMVMGGTVGALRYFSDELFIGGSAFDTTIADTFPTIWRKGIPNQGVPEYSVGQELNHIGSFVTPYVDFGYPDETKALRMLTFRTAGCTSTETVEVQVQVDNSVTWVSLNTIISDGSQRIDIEASADTIKLCKRVRFKLIISTGTVNGLPHVHKTDGPKVALPLTLHVTVSPIQRNKFTLQIALQENLTTLAGLESNSISFLNKELNSYIDTEKFPITLEEQFIPGTAIGTYRVRVQSIRVTAIEQNEGQSDTYVYEVVAIETPTDIGDAGYYGTDFYGETDYS